MYAKRTGNFGGMLPRLDTRLLPDQGAAVAQNVILTSGVFQPIYDALRLQTFADTDAVKTIYRMYSAGADYWLRWTEDVNVARSPIAGDTSFRVGFTSDAFEPRVTNLALATGSSPYPAAWYALGVFAPTTAPTITPSGGSGAQETRAYIYTFVTQDGEESAPCPASNVATGYVTGTWTLSAIQGAPANTYTISNVTYSGGQLRLTCTTTFGLRAGEYVTLSALQTNLNNSYQVAEVTSTTEFRITMATPGTITDTTGAATRDASHNLTSMVQRFYRTVTTDSGTDYYYLSERAASSSNYTDAVTTLGEPCPTVGWEQPPSDLHGLCVHPSGAWVGFSGNELCFSEPYANYAWPQEYRLTTDYPIVGIGVFGQAVIVATEGTPYVASGVEPSVMAMQKVDEPWPCLAKRGMVTTTGGVAYPTTQGLALIGLSGPQLITKAAYTYKEWSPLDPSSFIAAFYSNRYYTYYHILDGDTEGMLVIDFSENLPVTTSTKLPTAIYTDAGTGKLYFVEGNSLYEWEGDTGRRMPSEWRSKTFVLPPPASLGAAKIDCTFAMSAQQIADAEAAAASATAENAVLLADAGTYVQWHVRAGTGDAPLGAIRDQAIGLIGVRGSNLQNLPSASWEEVQFTLYKDGLAVYSVRVENNKVFRLPALGKYDNYQWAVSSNIDISAVIVGDTPLSLRTA